MDNEKRSGGSMNSGTYVPGLASVYDYDDYFEASLLSYDAFGVLHMIQYYPRIDSIYPNEGSMEGGTVVTIEGGGFPMEEADASIMIDDRKCVITYSSIEKIVCNTTAMANITIPSKVNIDHDVVTADVDDMWMTPSQIVGNWTEVSSSSASDGSYSMFSSDDTPGSGWITFIPGSDNEYGGVTASGNYELYLHLPATDSTCSSRAVNVSVVVRSGAGYSLELMNLNVTTSDLADSLGGSYLLVGNYTLLASATTMVSFSIPILFCLLNFCSLLSPSHFVYPSCPLGDSRQH
jgi:hypothetical protein